MGLIGMIGALLTGCRNKPDPVMQITPISFPEGVELSGFYMTHQGMAAGPYYVMKKTDTGIHMKISDRVPGDDYFGFVDTVTEDEYASHVILETEAPVRELEAAIEEAGALAWDGYRKNVAMKDVMDSGDLYVLYLELTDGTTVSMSGYNACPSGFQELWMSCQNIFEANSDYSRYYADTIKLIEDGGQKDHSDPDAPKIIESTELTFFSCEFAWYEIEETEEAFPEGVYTLEAKRDGGKVTGRFQLRTRFGEARDVPFEAEAFFLDRVQEIVTEYELARVNGHWVNTQGLPDMYGSSLHAEYASGETVEAYDNEDGFLPPEAMKDLAELFRSQSGAEVLE